MTRPFEAMVASIALTIMGCAGEIDGSPAPAATNDIADPMFLPPGMYEVGPIVASCDVNADWKTLVSSKAFVVRKGLGRNVVMPVRSAEGRWLVGRQDISLDQIKRESRYENKRCGGGSIQSTVELTSVSAERIAIRFTEEMIGCAPAVDSCTIDYSLTLVEAACRPPSDPACQTNTNYVSSNANGSFRQDVTCVCQ